MVMNARSFACLRILPIENETLSVSARTGAKSSTKVVTHRRDRAEATCYRDFIERNRSILFEDLTSVAQPFDEKPFARRHACGRFEAPLESANAHADSTSQY